MSKIIINIKSDITHDHAIAMVRSVINEWFISWDNQYCRGTTFTDREWKIRAVMAKKTRWDTHSFIVYDYPTWKP